MKIKKTNADQICVTSLTSNSGLDLIGDSWLTVYLGNYFSRSEGSDSFFEKVNFLNSFRGKGEFVYILGMEDLLILQDCINKPSLDSVKKIMWLKNQHIGVYQIFKNQTTMYCSSGTLKRNSNFLNSFEGSSKDILDSTGNDHKVYDGRHGLAISNYFNEYERFKYSINLGINRYIVVSKNGIIHNSIYGY